MNPVLLDPGFRQDCLPCTIWMMIFLWNILWVIRLGILCWRRRKCQRGWWVDYIWLVWRGFANSLWIVWNWIMFLCGFWWSPHFIVILAIVIHSVHLMVYLLYFWKEYLKIFLTYVPNAVKFIFFIMYCLSFCRNDLQILQNLPYNKFKIIENFN